MDPAANGSERFVILSGVDGSPQADEVTRVAARLSRMIPGAELHLVHVLEDLPPAQPAVPKPSGVGTAATDMLEAARRLLERATTDARRETQARIVAHLAAGEAWREIVQMAANLQADLVVVGTHGRSGIRRLVLGSVAELVERKASCPVLVVREKDYHAQAVPEIEPPCPDCVRVQRETRGERLWCDRHAAHHPHGRLHYEVPEAFGAGSMFILP